MQLAYGDNRWHSRGYGPLEEGRSQVRLLGLR